MATGEGHPWLRMSDPQLLDMFVRAQMNPQNPDSVAIRAILEYRTAEKQLRAAEQGAIAAAEGARAAADGTTSARSLAASPNDLVTMTRRLACTTLGTWGLVGATLVLVAAEVILKMWFGK